MAFIFTQIHAEISLELKEKCKNYFSACNSGSPTSCFPSLMRNICDLTGANFVDGKQPKLLGSWHSVKDTYDLLTGLLLQQNILNLYSEKLDTDKDSPKQCHDILKMKRDQSPGRSQCIHENLVKNVCSDSGACHSDGIFSRSRSDSLHGEPNGVLRSRSDDKAHSNNLDYQTSEFTPVQTVSQSDHHDMEYAIQNSNSNQANSQSVSSNSVIIDFQDVNFETLQNLGKGKESLEVVSVNVKKEIEDTTYSCGISEVPYNYVGSETHEHNESYNKNVYMNTEESVDDTFIMKETFSEDLNEETNQPQSEPPLSYCIYPESSQNRIHPKVEIDNTSTNHPNPKEVEPHSMLPVDNCRILQSDAIHSRTDPNDLFVKKMYGDTASFHCLVCTYKATCMKNIQDHVRRVHSERKFQCDICPARFGLKRDLNGHYKGKHKLFVKNQKPGRKPRFPDFNKR